VAIYTKVVMLYNTEFRRLDKALSQVKRFTKLGHTDKARKWLSEAERILTEIEKTLREAQCMS